MIRGRLSAALLFALVALAGGGGAARAGGEAAVSGLVCTLAVAPAAVPIGGTFQLTVRLDNRGAETVPVFLRGVEVEAALEAGDASGAPLARVPLRERMIAAATADDLLALAPGGRHELVLSGTVAEAPPRYRPDVLIDLGGSTAFRAARGAPVTFSLVYRPAAWLPPPLAARLAEDAVPCAPAHLRLID